MGMYAANARSGRLPYTPISPQQALQQRMAAQRKPSSVVQKTGDRCWGFELNAGTECDGAFRGVGAHLVDKFCARCRMNGVLVLQDRIRTIPPECNGNFTNSHKEGFWTDSTNRDVPRFRLINQTRHCTGLRLIIFDSDPPELPMLTPMSSDVCSAEPSRPGYIRLWLSKGTLLAGKPNWVHQRSLGPVQFVKRQRTDDEAAVAPTTPAVQQFQVAAAIVATAADPATATPRGDPEHAGASISAKEPAVAAEMEALAKGSSEDRLSTASSGTASPPTMSASSTEEQPRKEPPTIPCSMASGMARQTVCQA
jgi:hypothetical protein